MQVSQAITQRSASNLTLAFAALDREKRAAMATLYAFCREVDDVADDEAEPAEDRRRRLIEWRTDIRRACDGGVPRLSVSRELQPAIVKYNLSFELFDELLRGVEMDLDQNRYETIDDLELYCYRVASVVGLLSIRVFGHHHPESRDYAVHLGKALQLTNILRDVGNDALRGRIYMPLVLMREFGVEPKEVLQSEYSERFHGAAAELAVRAREHYQHAAALLPDGDRRAMIAAEAMGAVYWRILRKLEAIKFQVLSPTPTRLTKAHKLAIVTVVWLRNLMRSKAPNYGSD